MKEILRMHTKRVVEEDVEVEFPFYRKSEYDFDYACDIAFTKVLTKTTAVTITIRHKGVFELETRDRLDLELDGSSIDFLLGRGRHTSSKEEFDAALKKLKDAVNAIS